ncbi:MAG: OmpH family outer membrane protein [Verrucomicrobiota bacterium]|jgi:Skp family chaperone for outer membrane proteins|nr:OmpH family outer membrane protein [Verrucomicrobiota bacterium]
MTRLTIPKLAAVALALACLTGTAAAQEPLKIATIDLLETFDSYWKTKLSNDQLKERGADFDKARIGMMEDLRLLEEEYKKLNVSAQDPANSEEKRAADLKKAQERLAEFERLRQQIVDFNKNAQKTLADQTRRLRKGRLDEIQEVISAKAKELDYDLVIDSSQDVLLPRTPTVLFTTGKNDLTKMVVDILNQDAAGKYKPTDPAKPAATNPEKPATPELP